MKFIISILTIVFLSVSSFAEPMVNDGMRHDVAEIQHSVDQLTPHIAIGLGTGLVLLGINHLTGLNEPSSSRRWYIDDSWFFLVPVGFVAYDVAHIGFHGARIGLRIGKGI